MSISHIGFDQGPQGLSRSRERLDRLTSSANVGPSSNSSGDDQAERVGVVRNGSEYHRLAALHDRARVLASTIRTMDQAMEAANSTIETMKKSLNSIIKDFPPYPVGSEERVHRLRDFAALRAMIERLTIPPDEETRQRLAAARHNGEPQFQNDQWISVIGSDGSARTVWRKDMHIGPSGLIIPELTPPESVDDRSIEQALQQLDTASATIQARRDHLRETTFGATGMFSDQVITGEAAEAGSIHVQTDIAGQPVGLVHGSSVHLEQLLG
jgi:hypothetical protein